jgi:hypothetical protein
MHAQERAKNNTTVAIVRFVYRPGKNVNFESGWTGQVTTIGLIRQGAR